MMQLTRDTDHSGFIIKSYEPHRLVINETLYCESIILTPNSIESWAPKVFTDITAEHIQQLVNHAPEVILLGTGENQQFLNDSILRPLIPKNLGIEIMSTLSACYTFRILASEGRSVVAGLII